jgi:HSP20 family protein
MALNRFFNHRGFDDLFPPSFPSFFSPFPVFDMGPVVPPNFDRQFVNAQQQSMLLSPGFETRESADKYHLQVEMPGIKATDMNVELEDNGRVLHISGSRKRETEDEHGNRSFSSSRFARRITIGDNVDAEKMTANLQDGILSLEAPKIEKKEKAVFKIPITEDGESSSATTMKIKN